MRKVLAGWLVVAAALLPLGCSTAGAAPRISRELAVTIRSASAPTEGQGRAPRFEVEAELDFSKLSVDGQSPSVEKTRTSFPKAGGNLAEDIPSTAWVLRTPLEWSAVETTSGQLALGRAVDEGMTLTVRVDVFDATLQTGTMAIDCTALMKGMDPFVIKRTGVPFRAGETVRIAG